MVELNGKQYRITRKDGSEVNKGDTVVNFRGESMVFVGLERGPEYNGTSKVIVSATKAGTTRSYYHTGFDLTVTPV